MRLFSAALLAASLFTSLPLAAQLAPDQRDAVKALIREVIRTEPELIVEALQAMEAKQESQQRAAAVEAISTRKAEITGGPLTGTIANPQGDVTVTVFSDYRCGFCKKLDPDLRAVAGADSRVRLVVKELPILGPDSVTVARIALAGLQLDAKRYPELNRALMTHRGTLDEAAALKIAGQQGYDIERLKKAMAGADIQAAIQGNLALARALGIQGTPALVIGNQLIPGAVDQASLREAIAAAR